MVSAIIVCVLNYISCFSQSFFMSSQGIFACYSCRLVLYKSTYHTVHSLFFEFQIYTLSKLFAINKTKYPRHDTFLNGKYCIHIYKTSRNFMLLRNYLSLPPLLFNAYFKYYKSILHSH